MLNKYFQKNNTDISLAISPNCRQGTSKFLLILSQKGLKCANIYLTMVDIKFGNHAQEILSDGIFESRLW